MEAAANERPRTLERLVDIDRAVNQSMQMLRRYPELADKIGQLMDDYIQVMDRKLISFNWYFTTLICICRRFVPKTRLQVQCWP